MMKCRETAKLMDKYLENMLDKDTNRLFEEHLNLCKNCKAELVLVRSLLEEQSLHRKMKAPEGFTSTVMSSIYDLKLERQPLPSNDSSEKWRLAYRRLGFSLVLTAGIIMFSLLIPTVANYPSAISSTLQSGMEKPSESGFKNIFTGIDSGVVGVFRSINNSVTDFKGGTK